MSSLDTFKKQDPRIRARAGSTLIASRLIHSISNENPWEEVLRAAYELYMVWDVPIRTVAMALDQIITGEDPIASEEHHEITRAQIVCWLAGMKSLQPHPGNSGYTNDGSDARGKSTH